MAKKFNIQLKDIEDSDGGSIFMNEIDAFPNLHKCSEELNLLFVPLDDDVVYPYMNVGLRITNPVAKASVKKAHKGGEPAFFFWSDGFVTERLDEQEISDMRFIRGVIGFVREVNELPDGSLSILATLGYRAIEVDVNRTRPYLRGVVVTDFTEGIPNTAKTNDNFLELCHAYDGISSFLPQEDQDKLRELIQDIPLFCRKRIYFMCQNSPLNLEERYQLLETPKLEEQLKLLSDIFEDKKEELSVKAEIGFKTAAELGQRQREDYLRAQMEQIKNELGESEEAEFDELNKRANEKEWSEETQARFSKELKKLRRLNPTSADYAVQYAYIDTYLGLPWNHCDNSDFNLEKVQEILDRDHFGLEKVKERIVEQMAVLKLRKDTKSPILCLYGPPGVGKTSLGKSVAEALGRKYVRVALGGLHDEAEIRGHRRTYLGSMPGRIINALEKCGTSDPVMVLDEIDKIGADYKGDPAQALLEVLDPEQNCKFHDNYIDQDYDLSKVLFIATANTLSTISSPLLDRMELIEIGGYVEAEKIQIAQRHLIPKCLVEHGFEANEMSFDDEALMTIITDYTRESGVRRLEKKINEILRKQARLKACGKDFPKKVDVELVKKYLGKPEAFNDMYEGNDIPGIVTGLAWTQSGGEILFIESSTAPGKECKLVLTGNLGDVMKESAMLALQFIKANHDKLGIDEKKLEVGTVHVHVPEGAVPKDGPSAGVTIVTSLASTFTGRKVRSHLAMTGEITLRGKVLPVGGIKEKILAAKRSGIKTIMLCEKNRKDIEEIKPEYIEGLTFHYVNTVDEALDFALLKE